MNLQIILFCIVFKCLYIGCQCSLSDVTSKIFGQSSQGIVAAFGDFNADKSTDIFVLSNDGKTLTLLLGHAIVSPTVTESPFTRRMLLNKEDTGSLFITSVMPSDFDGDSMMDVLVTLQDKDRKSTKVRIYWGNGVNVDRERPLTLNETLLDQPAIFDWNGDMIPDLLGEDAAESRAIWILTQQAEWAAAHAGSHHSVTLDNNGIVYVRMRLADPVNNKDRNYTVEYMKNTTAAPLPPLFTPQSSAFLDFNYDFSPDLIVMSTSKTTNLGQFEVWLNQNGVFSWNETIAVPQEATLPGHPSFIDMDGDNEVDIVLPWCSDAACSSTNVSVYSAGKWHGLKILLRNAQHQMWNFVPISDQPLPWMQVPPILRIGDFNLNSFPDAVTVLTSNIKGNKTYGAFLLENVECGTDCDGFARTFRVSFTIPLSKQSRDPLQASFFDLHDTGVLDVFVNTINKSKSQITALKQTFSEDACFMKVMVTSGLCYENCPASHKPYGVNQVGPVVRFQTTTADGGTQIGVASQLTQSAYFSLQLPFVHFGLGQMPNFVEKLEVGIQAPMGMSPRYREWTQIIPNSQLVIIPYPPHQPSFWVNKLFVTPSRLVLMTGAALLGTCGFIAGIIGILHWKERAEDKKEKLQEAHKFHFDAM